MEKIENKINKDSILSKDLSLGKDEFVFKKKMEELSISNIIDTNFYDNWFKNKEQTIEKEKNEDKKILETRKSKINESRYNSLKNNFNKNLLKNDLYYETKISNFNNKKKVKSKNQLNRSKRLKSKKTIISNYEFDKLKNDNLISDRVDSNLINFYKNKIKKLEKEIYNLKNITNDELINSIKNKNEEDFNYIFNNLNKFYCKKFKKNSKLINVLTLNNNHKSYETDNISEKDNITKESINIEKEKLELEEVKKYINTNKKINYKKKQKRKIYK